LSKPDRVYEAVKRAHEAPFKTKSDFARRYAVEVAAAASLGWISTLNYGPSKVYSDRWSITRAGLKRLELEHDDE
jgi:hypothetical protein